jgi:hypothetical protein
MDRRPTARRPSRLVVAFLALAALCGRESIAHAQSARASFLLQMLRSNPEPRVRTNAALRLGELREPASVVPMVDILNTERDATVQATIIATLASIGDPRALPAVQQATRSSSRDVAAQARRAVGLLQAAASTAVGTNNADSTNGTPTRSNATPVVLIATGRVNVQSGVPSSLQSSAQRALESALDARGEVVRHSGSTAQASSTIRTRRLRGAHQFDVNIQSVTQQANGVRVAVSIVVSTFPGRAYEFDSSSAVTVSGGGGDPQQGAISTAMTAAVGRALTQVLSTIR